MQPFQIYRLGPERDGRAAALAEYDLALEAVAAAIRAERGRAGGGEAQREGEKQDKGDEFGPHAAASLSRISSQLELHGGPPV